MPRSKPSDHLAVAPMVQLDEAAPRPDIFKRIDKGFETVVRYMELVFFYRIGAHQRTFVETDHQEYYVRDRGSAGPFEQVDPHGVFKAKTLNDRQAEGLAARGMLLLGPDKNGKARVYRDGRLGNRLVEYVTVVIDRGTKYVGTKDKNGDLVYVRFDPKVAPARQLLSADPKDRLTPADVDRLAALGRLKIDDRKKKAGREKPYLLSEQAGGAPVVVLWLALGSVFFTLYMRGVNIWGFRHAVAIVLGRYDNPKEPGEVTHFQALSSALSATVGLGNIAGVTIAMTIGGPGAFFWMLACGAFGMTSKFVECTLGQKYRRVKPDGTVLGGPMQYLYVGLREIRLGRRLHLGPVGLVLSIAFAVMCILASFGGGNMFQANQSGTQLLSVLQRHQRKDLTRLNSDIKEAAKRATESDASREDFDKLAELQAARKRLQDKLDRAETIFRPIFGVLLAMMVGVVIIGGIKRIGAAAEKVVPTMCIIYILACLWIIAVHTAEVPALVVRIFTEAFHPVAFGGGMVGVLVIGVQRAAFSNEAGIGSAAIAHSAAKTKEPIREGAVAMLGPFIDTIVVCSMTALVILITRAWENEEWVVNQKLEGAALTTEAFGKEIRWFPYLLGVAVVLFAYSTMISWSYYGERCWERLFGPRSTVLYRIIYVTCIVVGAIVNLGAVLAFSDMMILSMAFPNVLGLALLSPKVRADLLDYWRRYKAGEFSTFRKRAAKE